MKRFKFIVTPKHKDGARYFPIDMLRYDRCYPITTEDANKISHVIDLGGADYVRDEAFKGMIELQSNDRAPSSARWESQGWTVTNVESFRQ
jgi:hypothetical protein